MLTALADFTPFLTVRQPAELSEYYTYGAEYVVDVSQAMGFDHDAVEEQVMNNRELLDANETNVDPETARNIASIFLDDAEWYRVFPQWRSFGRGLGFSLRFAPVIRGLEQVAQPYLEQIDSFNTPEYSRPDEKTVSGKPVSAQINNPQRLFLLGAGLINAEWFHHAATLHGVDVPDGLLERLIRETKEYFVRERTDLSPEVRKFQYHLFDEAIPWIKRFEGRYGGLIVSDGIRAPARADIEAIEWLVDTELRPSFDAPAEQSNKLISEDPIKADK